MVSKRFKMEEADQKKSTQKRAIEQTKNEPFEMKC